MHTRILSIVTAASLMTALAAAAGCSDDSNTTSAQSSSSSESVASSGSSSSSGAGGGGGAGGAGGSISKGPETLVSFDPAKGELVEGLDYRNGVAYVGAVLTGAVFSVDIAGKKAAPFGNMPAFAMNEAALVGLALGPDDLLYGCLSSFVAAPQTGVYRFAKAGGAATLFATHAEMMFVNDIRFNADGDMYVTDSFSGVIFKVSKDGSVVTKWAADPLLAPDPTVCNVQTNFHLGANGVVQKGDALYVTNTDRASVIKIPIMPGGAAGTPEIYLPTDCAKLSGVDGIAIDPHTDDLLIAVNYKNTIIRVEADKTIVTIAEGAPLSSPASLAIDPERDALLITSAAFEAIADPANAKPALVSLPLQ